MEQKTIWKVFLIIGISLAILTSCGKKIVDPPEPTVQFKSAYINGANSNLRMLLINADNDTINSYYIQTNDTLFLDMEYSSSIKLFQFENNKAKKVILKFSDNKCLVYSETSEPQGKIFDITKYDNYSQELIQNPPFILYYKITESEHSLATDCN